MKVFVFSSPGRRRRGARGLTASPAQQAAAIVRKMVQAIGFLVNAAGGLENAQSTRGRLAQMGSAEAGSRQVG